MSRNVWIGTGAGLLAGFLIGYFASASKAVVPAPATPVAPAGNPAMPGAPQTNFALQQAMFAAQQAVEKDPKNLQAWIALGNGYFDTHQPAKAIEAYAKALELDPRNPDILTDQGIMFKEIGAYQKAVANFEKANKINPKHVQSLYNLGIVYAHDLNAAPKAIQAWQKVIETDPTCDQAELSRKAIAELRASQPHP